MRVALFGGTFDPPHRGHVAIARAAADRFALDTVFFAPAGRQPLKGNTATASFEERLAMATLTCMEDPRFAVSNLDAPLPDGSPNYTVDTLARLATSLPDATLFSLIGADSFRSLGHWREPQRLFELAEWIVVSRPGFDLPEHAEPEGMALTDAQRARMHLLDSVHEDVSATLLRSRLRDGDPSEDLLPPLVARYIQEQKLYRQP